METKNSVILSVAEEQQLLTPINETIGGLQEKINALRLEGTDKVVSLTNHMAIVKENANYTKKEKAAIIAEDKAALTEAKAVEEKNRAEIKALIGNAVGYLDEHYDKEYYSKVVASCAAQKTEESARYDAELQELKRQHESELAKLKDKGEIKDDKTVMLETYENSDGQFAGFNLKPSDEKGELKFISVSNENAEGLDISFDSGDGTAVTAYGALKSENDVVNGSYTVTSTDDGEENMKVVYTMTDISANAS